MKGRVSIFFDWKAMGWLAYIPVILSILLIIYSKLNNYLLVEVVPATELLLPSFTSWWTIFIFQEILEESGGETLFTYPLKRWNLGVYRVVVFLILYLVLIILTQLFILKNVGYKDFISFTIQLGVQSLFFGTLGFLLIVITRNTGWSIVIIASYVSLQILTKGEFLTLLNVFTFKNRILPLESIVEFSVKPILLSIIFCTLSQILFSTTKRYQ